MALPQIYCNCVYQLHQTNENYVVLVFVRLQCTKDVVYHIVQGTKQWKRIDKQYKQGSDISDVFSIVNSLLAVTQSSG